MHLSYNLLNISPPDEKEEDDLPLLDENDDHTETSPTAPPILKEDEKSS
ncbi:MAG: hypothetical protein ACPG7F_14355 [Aggregatilineales bacterium]